jgi:nucleotide-binding universal stress UspA family protein
MNRHILIPVNHNEQSEHAVMWAIDHILHSDDQVTLLHVYDINKMFLYGRIPELSEHLMSIDEKARKNGEILLDRLLSICQNHPVRQIKATGKLLAGDPEEMIVEVCRKERVDAVVVGSRGQGALKRTFLSSVSDYCLHHCPCPVIVVKSTAMPHEKPE